MEASRVIVDTNLVIDHFRKNNKKNTTFYKLCQKYRVTITSISLFELLFGCTTPQHKLEIIEILSGVDVFPLDAQSAEIAAKEKRMLLKKNKQIEITDALIAGIVLSNQLPLATLNRKHFEHFHGIELINLDEL